MKTKRNAFQTATSHIAAHAARKKSPEKTRSSRPAISNTWSSSQPAFGKDPWRVGAPATNVETARRAGGQSLGAKDVVSPLSEAIDDRVLELIHRADRGLKQYRQDKDKTFGMGYAFRLPVLIREFDFMGAKAIPDSERHDVVLVDVGYLTPLPFPQSYTITMSRTTDWMWYFTHMCTPFSFRTLVERQSLSLHGEQGFRMFGKMVIDLVESIVANPQQYQALLLHYRRENACALVFSEIVGGIRSVPLLALDFRATQWSEMRDMLVAQHQFLTKTLAQVQERLARVLDIVQQHAPGLMLHLSAQKLTTPSVSRGWFEHTKRVISTNRPVATTGDHGNVSVNALPLSSAVSRQAGKTNALFERDIFVSAHSPPTPDQSSRTANPAPVRQRFRCALLATPPLDRVGDSAQGRDATRNVQFTLTLTDPANPLLYLRSTPITRDVWAAMVRGQNHVDVGFLPTEGIGGVLGLVSECLQGCSADGRFTANLALAPATSTPTRAGHLPPPRTATLTFHEHLKYRTHALLMFHLAEANDDGIRAHLGECMARLQEEYTATVARLESYLSTIRQRKPALLLHLPQLRVPSGSPESVRRWAAAATTTVEDQVAEERAAVRDAVQSRDAWLWPALMREGTFATRAGGSSERN
ncbi:hypothetical protein AMAG_15342 [Allomyces macrogynus ATCC 38327]|uniref:Uncharacterized protein n=1 Tax=Allomyces macrogynus (strain ATCC 38327) TaxID=578462 RepID=A0A0L0T8L8_ALLM3|nr:hypothetical protein AMAG_15342 [Allomyces macrogynus ATCC 38327]|eukprot:KNE71092.1 hypothetical protein AMAG_15342 [Allomyces macrogynus ATCC 38327]